MGPGEAHRMVPRHMGANRNGNSKARESLLTTIRRTVGRGRNCRDDHLAVFPPFAWPFNLMLLSLGTHRTSRAETTRARKHAAGLGICALLGAMRLQLCEQPHVGRLAV
jgi:hypothetical protein